MALRYNPKIITDNLVLNLDPSHNKSYPTIDLPVKDGLILWLDSSDDSTFSYSSGTAVSQWRDKSGLNNHINQSNATYQPARSTNTFSRKSVEFSSDYLNTSSNILKAYTSYTKIVVAKQTSIATYGNIIGRSTGANTTMWYNASNNIALYHNSNTILTSSIATTINTWNILSGTFDTIALTANIYVNGSSGGSATSPTVTQLTTDSDVQIGAFGNGNNFTGEIAEILIFNKVLSSVERKLVHTYLGQKWGISNTDRSGIDLASSSTNTWLLGDGTTANMPQYSVYNKTFNFDGSNDIISYPYNLGTYSSYSFCFWARRNAEDKMALSSYGSASFYWYGDNSWAYTHGGVAGEKYYNKSVSIPLGSYGHYCVTYDGTTVKIYRNSVLEDSQATTGTAVFSAGLQLGKYGSSTSYMFNGDISNFLMYSKALSASEISDIYESQKSRFINYIVTQGLVLNLDAGNPYSYAGSGSIIYDVSGSANNGTLNNSPTYSSDSNGILLFNGSSQYVGIANSSSLQVADTFTVSAWVKATDLSNRYGVFSTRANNTTGCWQFEVGTGNGGTGRIVLTGIGTYISESVNSVITTNTWYHITVVKVNNATQGATFYVNGSAVSNVGTAAYTISNNSDEKRIAIGTGSAQYFPGYIAQTFVYNRALSASEVLQNYNATKARFGL